MFLLDTNVISETRKLRQNKADKNVTHWLANVSLNSFHANPVVLMEIERGILRMERKDPVQASMLRTWYQVAVKPMFNDRVLPIDEETATICALLHFPDLSPENDAWIAASALQYDLTLVTRNVKDFKHTNVRLLNPFSDEISGAL